MSIAFGKCAIYIGAIYIGATAIIKRVQNQWKNRRKPKNQAVSISMAGKKQRKQATSGKSEMLKII